MSEIKFLEKLTNHLEKLPGVGKKTAQRYAYYIADKIEYSKYIDYKEFLELYEEYKSRISEIEFAQILGMSYGGYERIKNLETARAKIMAGKGKIIGKDKKCIQDEVLKEIGLDGCSGCCLVRHL